MPDKLPPSQVRKSSEDVVASGKFGLKKFGPHKNCGSKKFRPKMARDASHKKTKKVAVKAHFSVLKSSWQI